MLEGVPLAALGPMGVILVLWTYPVLLVLRGKLVPRQALDDEREDTREWREAHKLSEAARVVQAEQTRQLLAHAETANTLLKSITERAKG